MAPHPSALGAVSWEPETNWGEDVTTFATRLQPVGAVDLSGLVQEKLNPERLVQYRNEITPGVNGVMGGEFKTTHLLTGHGSTTNTTIALNALETLLGVAIGNVVAAFTGANTTATAGGTTTTFGTAAASGAQSASVVRIGTLNDGRGGGQFYWVSGHAGSSMVVKNALIAAPALNDIIYNPAIIHPSELPTSNSITGARFLLQTANQSAECHGVYPKAVAFSGLSPGELPTVEVTWGVSWWRFSTATFPSATSVQTFPAAPVAAGSFWLNTFGTTTRTVRSIRQFTLTYELGITELRGPGGVNQYQPVIGCVRSVDKVSIEWVEDADTNSATPELTGWDTNAAYSLVYTLSGADGTAVGFLFPYVVPDGPRPTQTAMDNVNRKRFRARCGADNTLTTNLRCSAMRLALA